MKFHNMEDFAGLSQNKVSRAPRICFKQKEIMIQLLEEYLKTKHGHCDNVDDPFVPRSQWKIFSKKLNHYGPSKTVDEWQKCFNYIKLRVKLKMKKGQEYKFLLEIEQKIFNMFGKNWNDSTYKQKTPFGQSEGFPSNQLKGSDQFGSAISSPEVVAEQHSHGNDCIISDDVATAGTGVPGEQGAREATHTHANGRMEDASDILCSLCGSMDATSHCTLCNDQQFCLSCDERYHSHPIRVAHIREVLSIPRSQRDEEDEHESGVKGDATEGTQDHSDGFGQMETGLLEITSLQPTESVQPTKASTNTVSRKMSTHILASLSSAPNRRGTIVLSSSLTELQSANMQTSQSVAFNDFHSESHIVEHQSCNRRKMSSPVDSRGGLLRFYRNSGSYDMVRESLYMQRQFIDLTRSNHAQMQDMFMAFTAAMSGFSETIRALNRNNANSN